MAVSCTGLQGTFWVEWQKFRSPQPRSVIVSMILSKPALQTSSTLIWYWQCTSLSTSYPQSYCVPSHCFSKGEGHLWERTRNNPHLPANSVWHCSQQGFLLCTAIWLPAQLSLGIVLHVLPQLVTGSPYLISWP